VIQLINRAKSSSCAAEYIYLRYWASNCAAMQDLNRKQDDLLQWQIAASQARGTKPQVIFSKSWRRRLAVLERKLKVKCASLCWVYFPRLGSTQRCSGWLSPAARRSLLFVLGRHQLRPHSPRTLPPAPRRTTEIPKMATRRRVPHYRRRKVIMWRLQPRDIAFTWSHLEKSSLFSIR
jgi:hypothetical protein